jgi:hypothetical protein
MTCTVVVVYVKLCEVARLDRAGTRTGKNEEEVYISIKEDSTRKLIRARLE